MFQTLKIFENVCIRVSRIGAVVFKILKKCLTIDFYDIP